MNSDREPALVLKIKALMATLSRSEQAVAHYIAEHPEEVIYLSTSALAQKSGVSDPTVVRTCQKLGLKGYQSLKVMLAQDIVNPLKGASKELKPGDDMDTILGKIFAADINALEVCRETLSRESTELAAEKIMKAKRVLIYAMYGGCPQAVDLQHKLMSLGIDAAAYTDDRLQDFSASYADEEDVVFAFSGSGGSKNVTENSIRAKENGAFLINLSGIGYSPISKAADINIYTAADSKSPSFSAAAEIAGLAITDSIYAYIAMHRTETPEAEKPSGEE